MRLTFFTLGHLIEIHLWHFAAQDGWCEVEEGLLCISLEKMSGLIRHESIKASRLSRAGSLGHLTDVKHPL
ncbi:hypothetical protein P8452_39050 [Trifolium repens]|nr:hypothetical protein P8452_39050 [Trifolium repens]